MVNLLEVLPAYVLHWIVVNGTDRHLATGEHLRRNGETSDSLAIVLDGILCVELDGRPFERHSAGSVLGETAFFSDGHPPETAVAEEPSRVLEISREALPGKLAHDALYAADFYRALLQTTTQKLRQATLRLQAAEAVTDLPADPVAGRAHRAITAFKQMIVALDKEAIKNGGLTEERQQEFIGQSMALMMGADPQDRGGHEPSLRPVPVPAALHAHRL